MDSADGGAIPNSSLSRQVSSDVYLGIASVMAKVSVHETGFTRCVLAPTSRASIIAASAYEMSRSADA